MSLTNIIYTINFLLILWFVFYQNKNYRISLKWLLLFLLIPLFSFVLYFFLGKGISINKKKYLQVKERVNRLFKEDNLKLKVNDQELDKQVKLNVKLDGYNLTYYNKIDYFCSGEKYFSTLFFDILQAKSSIHIQMYIIRDDKLKDELMELLLKKAKDGVKIKILYENIGNLKNKKNFLSKYKHENIKIVKFNPFLYSLRNVNYRNHKKLVIIDGRIGYIGGFNIGEEYLSLNPRLSPFRDSVIRVYGESVCQLQKAFLIDFYYASSLFKPFFSIDVNKQDITCYYANNHCPMQLMTSSFEIRENLKRSKLNLLHLAKEEVYIQTPYFILDPLVSEEIKLLLLKGVKVKIMVPLKYDQLIPYSVSLWTLRELYSLGAVIYLYNGFIHAKSLVIDEFALVIGSSNFDIRSNSLNLESDMFIYSKEEIEEYKKIFNKDIKDSLEYSIQLEESLYKYLKFGKRFFRLLSSIL